MKCFSGSWRSRRRREFDWTGAEAPFISTPHIPRAEARGLHTSASDSGFNFAARGSPSAIVSRAGACPELVESHPRHTRFPRDKEAAGPSLALRMTIVKMAGREGELSAVHATCPSTSLGASFRPRRASVWRPAGEASSGKGAPPQNVPFALLTLCGRFH
jgi:hypothetical protein